jgi:hypothetical protein
MIPFPTFLDNPILVRELRRRMRGRALVYSMIGYICIITLIAVFIMLAKTPVTTVTIQSPGAGENFLTQLIDCGRSIFKWITWIQILLVLIIAPTITAGMTTGEKERKTFEFLQVTTIHPWAYILGSFLSTVFYVGLALLCALPPLCLTFLYGGVAPSDVMNSFLLLFAGSLVLSSFGLYISSVRDRTRAAQGIVVFVIFLLVFGGLTFLRSFARFFGGLGLGGGTGAGGGSAGMYVFGLGISPGILLALVTVFLTTVFLLLATRKLYQSDERAFAYWQYAILFLLTMGVMIGLAWQQSVGDRGLLTFVIVSASLLATAAVCFGVGFLEVGDEIWHLKRLIPVLRPFDESLLFLAGVGAAWAWLSFVWLRVPMTTSASAALVRALVWVMLPSLVFFVFLGRMLTAVYYTRKMAGRLAMGAIALFWLGLPLFGSMLSSLTSVLEPAQEALERFSPIFLTLEYIREQGAGQASTFAHYSGLSLPGAAQGIIYLGLAGIAALYGESRRWRYTRRIDYHYEMPEG